MSEDEKKNAEEIIEPYDPTRRSFLQAAIGSALTATAIGGAGFEFVQLKSRVNEKEQANVRQPKISDAELRINGKTHQVSVPHERTLLLALREDLGLTGTKKGCNLGQCGACTVLLDEAPVYSCFMLAMDAVGHEITTIEGLEKDGVLHPLQQSFIENLGSQCGHCTPGMILSGVALLKEKSRPTVDEVKQALSGNLCRCGNYANEIVSVIAAAGLQRQQDMIAGNTPKRSSMPAFISESDFAKLQVNQQAPPPSYISQIGSSMITLDAQAKATGRAHYAGDLGFHVDDEFAKPLFAKVLRSPYPHAKVADIDDTLARQLPGYRGMITFKEVPEFKLDRHFLNDKARFVGDAIAAVAADDQYTAQAALDLLRVNFSPLDFYLDAEETFKRGVKDIHANTLAGFGGPQSANQPTIEFKHGDTGEGFKQADLITEGRYTTPIQCHVPIEMNCCTAHWRGDELTLWDSQQSPHRARDVIAEVLKIPHEKVRIISQFVGGGFGGKCAEDPGKTLYQAIAALLAKKTGKPVRLEFTLKENMFGEDVRNPFVMVLKTGVKNDGTITAIECKAIQRSGGYASTSAAVASVAGEGIVGTYRCENFWYHAYCVYTNTPVGGELRGFGHPQAVYCLEAHMDKVAEAVGMNPLEFRLKNYLRSGEKMLSVGGAMLPIASSGLEECMKRGAQAVGWDRWESPDKKSGRVRRGLGMRISQEHSGRDASVGLLSLDRQGKIHVPLGIGNMGTEAHTGIALIVAEALRVPVEELNVTWGDSANTAWDFVGDASRALHCCGKAYWNAAQDLLNQLYKIAAPMLGTTEDQLEPFNKGVRAKGGGRVIDFKTLVAQAKPRDTFAPFCNPQIDISPKLNEQTGAIETPEPKLDPHTEKMARQLTNEGLVGLGFYVFNLGVKSWGAGFVECEVDMTTGQVNILKFVCAHDVGRVIHRPSVEAQIYGGGVFGLGYGWTEELLVDPNTGIPVNTSLQEYRPLTILDVPELISIVVEAPVEAGPFGAKGLGENPVLNGAAALANAIYNATGVRIDEIPLTWPRVYDALKKAGKLMN
jgi:CO/xanthine dehydrogenase Mo-binding subunit/aerobic-type carbon monoxide dehydrogenase small subunit (CoxS/CutS family)